MLNVFLMLAIAVLAAVILGWLGRRLRGAGGAFVANPILWAAAFVAMVVGGLLTASPR